MIDVFCNPDMQSMEAAHADGLLNWHREDRRNPYMLAGEAVSLSLAWAWEFGRREGVYMHAIRRAALTESDRVNAETLGKLKAAEDPRQAARWSFRKAAGGGA